MNILPNCLNLILADIINDKYNVEEEDQFEFMSVIGIFNFINLSENI